MQQKRGGDGDGSWHISPYRSSSCWKLPASVRYCIDRLARVRCQGFCLPTSADGPKSGSTTTMYLHPDFKVGDTEYAVTMALATGVLSSLYHSHTPPRTA